MGKPSRDKGGRREREIAALLPGAKRIGYSYKVGPDLIWMDRTVEVKAKASGFKFLYNTVLKDAQIGALKADREPWLIVLPLTELLDLRDEWMGNT